MTQENHKLCVHVTSVRASYAF